MPTAWAHHAKAGGCTTNQPRWIRLRVQGVKGVRVEIPVPNEAKALFVSRHLVAAAGESRRNLGAHRLAFFFSVICT